MHVDSRAVSRRPGCRFPHHAADRLNRTRVPAPPIPPPCSYQCEQTSKGTGCTTKGEPEQGVCF